MPLNPYQKYSATRVETASSVDLVVMLYQGAVKFIRLGIEALERDDRAAASKHLISAQNIVVELTGSLNHEAGGQIASQLAAVYDYCFRQLVLANLRRDAAMAREVMRILKDLGTAWQEIALQQRHAQAAASQAPGSPAPAAVRSA